MSLFCSLVSAARINLLSSLFRFRTVPFVISDVCFVSICWPLNLFTSFQVSQTFHSCLTALALTSLTPLCEHATGQKGSIFEQVLHTEVWDVVGEASCEDARDDPCLRNSWLAATVNIPEALSMLGTEFAFECVLPKSFMCLPASSDCSSFLFFSLPSRFDIYRKVPKDLTQPTYTGAFSEQCSQLSYHLIHRSIQI